MLVEKWISILLITHMYMYGFGCVYMSVLVYLCVVCVRESVCLCVYVHVYVCIVHLCFTVCACVSVYVSVSLCTYINTCVNVCPRICECVSLCMFMYVCVYMYVCVCMCEHLPVSLYEEQIEERRRIWKLILVLWNVSQPSSSLDWVNVERKTEISSHQVQ